MYVHFWWFRSWLGRFRVTWYDFKINEFSWIDENQSNSLETNSKSRISSIQLQSNKFWPNNITERAPKIANFACLFCRFPLHYLCGWWASATVVWSVQHIQQQHMWRLNMWFLVVSYHADWYSMGGRCVCAIRDREKKKPTNNFFLINKRKNNENNK